ncbi:LysR family transcriptional regulator [Paraburkholderia phenazinium]|jgi:DNA-binding transcriptional LysR family regulator|uniref:DNA-binding transcriptional regulator, LysR family n=1 Tax=Paraburkholderia phenazinium TaxID=60549 RepID=A0A1G8N672_9BURK|nr:LysR family transcriptional regulator [Paraburkholderia phenazinium]SDI75586.1 DNA-binding transcriptional regulator, LysR family [Paraburkholderia phenazinium]
MAAFDPNAVVRKLASRLKMRHLTLLLQIQQHGSLTRAAEHLASSQPAVTNALAELEDMFGAPLFDRSARGMAPTALGHVVLARARAMTEDLDHLVREMEAVASGHAAHLHIGVIPFIPGQMVSTAIQRTRPEGERRLTVTIHEGTSEQLLVQLRDHTVDIVIGRASSSLDLQQVSVEVLYRQQPRLIASRRLAARLARGRLDWQRLVELDWILGAPNTPMREQVADIFLGAGLTPPTPIVESYSSKLIGEMIVAGEQSVSIVPADIAEELVRIAGVAIVPYSFEWTLSPIALFTRLHEAQRMPSRLFSASLRQVCQEIYSRPSPS